MRTSLPLQYPNPAVEARPAIVCCMRVEFIGEPNLAVAKRKRGQPSTDDRARGLSTRSGAPLYRSELLGTRWAVGAVPPQLGQRVGAGDDRLNLEHPLHRCGISCRRSELR